MTQFNIRIGRLNETFTFEAPKDSVRAAAKLGFEAWLNDRVPAIRRKDFDTDEAHQNAIRTMIKFRIQQIEAGEMHKRWRRRDP